MDLVFHAAVDLAVNGPENFATATADFGFRSTHFGNYFDEVYMLDPAGNKVGPVVGHDEGRALTWSREVLKRHTVRAEIFGAMSPLSFSFEALTSGRVYENYKFYAPEGFSGHARGDMSSTAGISAVRFLDASGGDVTDQVAYSFDHDMTFYSGPATTTTPEPVNLVLLGTGLAGLGAVRRRRKRERLSV